MLEARIHGFHIYHRTSVAIDDNRIVLNLLTLKKPLLRAKACRNLGRRWVAAEGLLVGAFLLIGDGVRGLLQEVLTLITAAKRVIRKIPLDSQAHPLRKLCELLQEYALVWLLRNSLETFLVYETGCVEVPTVFLQHEGPVRKQSRFGRTYLVCEHVAVDCLRILDHLSVF